MEELPCLLHTHVCVHTEILLRDHTNIYFQDCCHAYLKTRAAELAAEHYSLLRRQLPPNPTAQLLFKEWGLVQADLPSLLSNTQIRFKKGQTLNYNKYLSWADYSTAVFTQPFEKNLLKLTFWYHVKYYGGASKQKITTMLYFAFAPYSLGFFFVCFVQSPLLLRTFCMAC